MVQPNTLVSRVGAWRTSAAGRCAVGEAESYRPQFAQSCGGGGGDTSLPLGRKDDEDNRNSPNHAVEVVATHRSLGGARMMKTTAASPTAA